MVEESSQMAENEVTHENYEMEASYLFTWYQVEAKII